MKEFVYERIRPSIPKSSWLYRCVKVRKVTKIVCKVNTKRVKWNEVTQHKKKYLLNCSVRVYQRIMKLTYRASRFLEMFCCNRPTSLYESQTEAKQFQSMYRYEFCWAKGSTILLRATRDSQVIKLKRMNDLEILRRREER